ncbi:hypothetical protein K7X08_030587 [Anisodus acutangulus]|uniref:HMA domain-containing protein n=1 Tax=Anisodus acutangulus TaxID=402998 RepID=A0A9Q1MUF7_9SOLA|nr:hypothetical protein K7X08_030587 [Anisodus acutangulus]
MAYSLVAPNTFALKLKIHCKICEKKLRNTLLKIQGVHSVKIDEKLGNVVISGTVDPATILTMLEKLGRKAELLWEQGQPINGSTAASSVYSGFGEGPSINGSTVHKASSIYSVFEERPPINDSKNVQIITQSKVINPLNDSEIMTQLEQLSGIPGLQTIEVTRTIKLTFQGESRSEPGDKVEITTADNLNKPHHQFEQFDHSHGGGFCAASSSCCGGHAASSHSHNLHGCCHGNTSCNFGSCCANNRNCCYSHCPPPMENWGRARPSNSQPPPVLTAPSQSSGSTIASAPPFPSDYYQAPPSLSPIHHTYYSALSDENANGCIIQ